MTEGKTFPIELTTQQLRIIINALGSSSPNKEDENAQFVLYHTLVFKLNSAIKNGSQ